MHARIGAMIICLLMLVSGCAQPVVPSASNRPQSPGGDSSATTIPDTNNLPRPVPKPTVPVSGSPRLLLDLPLGDEPDQPGSMPSRVGGITPRGPLAMAAEWGSVFLVDQAKGRVLHYADDQLADSISVPWLDEQGGDLRISPFGMVLTVSGTEYTVARNGQLLNVRSLSADSTLAADRGKGPALLGKDGVGNLYERGMGDHGPVARRVSKEGSVLAVVSLEEIGEIRDWCMGRDGSLYALAWQWGQDRIDRIRVYEIFPTVTFSSPPGGVDPPTPPVVLGHPIPSRIRLRFPDWAPLEVNGEIDRWNLWQLLATTSPAADPAAGDPAWHVTMEASFLNASTLTLHIRDDYLTVEGTRYRVGGFGALRSLIEALRLSEQGVKGALDVAQSVRIALEDLPGVEQELSPAQRQELRESLTGAMAVNPYTPPQPLERPFPQYAIRLKGLNWEGTLLLVGDRYLMKLPSRAVVHSGRTAALVKGWLPKPDLRPDQVGYLYLADRLEIGQGNDLTRWKDSVVRQLIHARFDPEVRPAFQEPFTLSFWVKGQKRTVQVDTEGFTYAGKRYRGSGLTGIASLQGVP